MRKRIRRTSKKLVKSGKWLIILGVGLFIGIAIGAEGSITRESVVIYNDSNAPFDDHQSITIERHIHDQIIEEIVIPPIPDLPEIPEIPEIPQVPTTIYVDHSPSFFEVINGISSIVAALGLMGLGFFMLVRGRRIKEKSPDSIA